MSKTQKYKIKTQFRMLKKFKEQRAAVKDYVHTLGFDLNGQWSFIRGATIS